MRSAFFPVFVVTCWGLGADVAGRPAAARGDDRASKAEQSIPDVAALEAVRNTRGDLAAAELLWQMARKGRLTRSLLKQAADADAELHARAAGATYAGDADPYLPDTPREGRSSAEHGLDETDA